MTDILCQTTSSDSHIHSQTYLGIEVSYRTLTGSALSIAEDRTPRFVCELTIDPNVFPVPSTARQGVQNRVANHSIN